LKENNTSLQWLNLDVEMENNKTIYFYEKNKFIKIGVYNPNQLTHSKLPFTPTSNCNCKYQSMSYFYGL
jgi:hypothetical protein